MFTQDEWKIMDKSPLYFDIGNGSDRIALIPVITINAEDNAHLITAAPYLYGALKFAHDNMDRINGEKGNEKELCIFCHAIEHDASGIAHFPFCPILIARDVMTKAEGK
jgi:hypothetical protein